MNLTLARSSILRNAASPLEAVVLQAVQIGTEDECFVSFVRDGVTYFDIFTFDDAGDVATITGTLAGGEYLTFTFTLGANETAQPEIQSVTLVD